MSLLKIQIVEPAMFLTGESVSRGVDWTVVGIEESNCWEPQTVLQINTD
jgi:hypothetical protein